MGDYPDAGDMDKERLRRQMAKEETPGTPVGGVLHSFGTVTWIGDGGPEHVEIPKGASVVQRFHTDEGDTIVGEQGPEVFIPTDDVPLPQGVKRYLRSWRCAGPECLSCMVGGFYPVGWIDLQRRPGTNVMQHYDFCSLRCLANWLAGELAKEEDSHGPS